MFKISLFKVGLIAMLFFVMASNVLNYVAIGTNSWTEDTNARLWYDCITNNGKTESRYKCFRDNPPALIATGTALNILSFILIIVAQVALFVPKFRDSIALYFVMGALLTTLLSLLFSAIGWFFIFVPQYQNLVADANGNFLSFRFGYSFWLMTPSFACSIIAGLIGAAILGCTCVTLTNKKPTVVERLPQDIRL